MSFRRRLKLSILMWSAPVSSGQGIVARIDMSVVAKPNVAAVAQTPGTIWLEHKRRNPPLMLARVMRSHELASARHNLLLLMFQGH